MAKRSLHSSILLALLLELPLPNELDDFVKLNLTLLRDLINELGDIRWVCLILLE